MSKKLRVEVENYMMLKVHNKYHNAWKYYYNILSGYYGYNLTTKFADTEKLKLVNYLAINSNLRTWEKE